MSFIPLKISQNTPTNVKVLIDRQIKMQFEDIHTMLRLPIREQELFAGCNFAAANSLLAMISGFSALLTENLDTTSRSRPMFEAVMKTYYPWDVQSPEGDTTPHGIDGTIDHLYEQFRNPLAHSLGIKPKGNYQVVIEKNGLSESDIERLEQTTSSPGPAVRYSPIVIKNESIEQIRLNIAFFYWGVREMLYRITNDNALMKSVESNLTRLGL